MSICRYGESVTPCCPPVLQGALSKGDAEELAATLKALADPVRLRLLSFIAAQPEGEACVCHVIDPMGLSQPTVSHHLKLLHQAGLLEREKRGAWVYYRVDTGAARGDPRGAHDARAAAEDRKARMSRETPTPLASGPSAEAVGTALLLATVVGSGIMGERLAGGNVAIALAREYGRDGCGACRLDSTAWRPSRARISTPS